MSAPFSQIAGVFKIPVTSYASSAPSLDDREIYKYFTRTIPSDASIAIAFRDGCHVNQWTNVGIISYPDEHRGPRGTWNAGRVRRARERPADA